MQSSPHLRAFGGCLLLLALANAAHARTWTNLEGKQIEAEYVRLDSLNVVLLMNGREVSVPLTNLSDADKQFVFQQQLGGGATARSPLASDNPRKTANPTATASDDASEADSDDNPSSRRGSSPPGTARIRSWKDNRGRTIRAKYIRIHEGNVVLMQGRKTATCPLANLSPEDQEYLRELLTARGEGHLMPSAEQLAAARNLGSSDGGASYQGIGGAYTGGFSAGAAPGSGPMPGLGAASGYGVGGGYGTPYTINGGAPGGMASAGAAAPYSSGAGAYGNPYGPGASEATSSYAGSPSSAIPGYPGSSAPPYDVTTPGSADYGSGASFSSAGYASNSFASTPSYGAGMGSSGYPSSMDMGGASPASFPGGTTPPEISSAPTFPSLETSLPQQQITYYCSRCNKEVPEHINDRCPHCGVRFDYVEQPDGSRKYNGRLWAGGGIGTLIAVVIGVVIRLIVYAQRNR